MDGDEEDTYLPFELITLILLRLPVKSLLRFKCVCKSWFSLISHSHFTNSHYELNSDTHTRRILLITPDLKSRSIEFEASLNDDSASYSPDIRFLLDDDYSSSTSSDMDMDMDLSTLPRDIEIQGSCKGFIFLTRSSTSWHMDFSLPRILFKLDFKGSCRGFILLNCRSSLCIWNPSTGVHKYIPFTNIDTNPKANYFYGFGYDPSIDDYLVLSMSYDPDRDDMLSHLGIFSLRANVWSEIEGGNLLPYLQDSVLSLVEVLLNGAIHWMAFRHDISMSVIVGFHLIERKLLELRLPNEIIYGPSKVYDFWVFRGCLSLWDMWYDNGTIEIWVMKKYSVQSSWTKTLVLSLTGIPTHFFCPKYYTKSGDIVGSDSANALAKYNDKGLLIEHRSYCKHTYGSLVVMYTESLLSIPGGDNGQA